MVIYDLTCDASHRFEGWFSNREDFESQLASGLVECPLCGSKNLTEKPVAPAFHGPKRTAQLEAAKNADQAKATTTPKAPGSDKTTELRAAVDLLQRLIKDHFEDVGDDFAEEALAIYVGDTEAKNIAGTMTEEEEQELDELEVPFTKIRIPRFDD